MSVFVLTSLSMIISSCTHVAANGIVLLSVSSGRAVFHCIYSPRLYPFLCQWVPKLFPLAIVSSDAIEMAVSVVSSYSFVQI